MEPQDGRIILFILVAIALFSLGRRFQTMLMSRQALKQTTKQLTARKAVAQNATKSMIGVTLLVVFVIWLVVNLNRTM
ncbi:hypothetical protein ACFMQL_06010 [Nonomuraea fastidiosa]|uniref:hypothetical protein n=1 Tax=Nonomuraea TaxID=83681 RepID=UPI003243B45F